MDSYGSVPFSSLFRRCVACSDATPSCPESCPSGQICSLIPPTCNECQKTACVASSAAPATVSTAPKSSSSGPNVGGIAGGIIGGVAVIAIVTYLVWRFCIKTKRQQYEQENWAEYPDEETEAEKNFTMRRDARASTHTVASLASTVLTRASNIIQIAYIPGVTNRSAPSTPGLLVPPVPPIPIALSDAGSPRYEQEHFFMPGDLRDSTYSGMSDRTSYARNSVASTIYGKNAVVSPVPAQTMIRGKAAVVSVKPNGQSTGELTPPVPSVDYNRFGPGGPPSPAFSVGSTFLNSANTATQIRPQVVRVVSSQKKVTPTPSVIVSDGEATPRASAPNRDSNAITIIDDTPTIDQGPFNDPPSIRQSSNSSLGAVVEEASTKKVRSPKNDSGLFGDHNELKE